MLRSVVLSLSLLLGLAAVASGHPESVEAQRSMDTRLLQPPQLGHCARCSGKPTRDDALMRELGAFVDSIARCDWVATRSRLATHKVDVTGRRSRCSAEDLNAQLALMQRHRVDVVCFERPVSFDARGSTARATLYVVACIEYWVDDQVYSSWVALRCVREGEHWRFSGIVPPDVPWQPPPLVQTVGAAIERPPPPMSPN
jgi:hypothetical protein